MEVLTVLQVVVSAWLLAEFVRWTVISVREWRADRRMARRLRDVMGRSERRPEDYTAWM